MSLPSDRQVMSDQQMNLALKVGDLNGEIDGIEQDFKADSQMDSEIGRLVLVVAVANGCLAIQV